MFLLFSLAEFFADFNLVLKIFVLLTIISFVLNHIGKGPLGWGLILGLSVFILFDFWAFFGPVYILYMLLVLGVSGIVIDFFFVSGMGGGGEAQPVDSGKDLMMRQRELQQRQAHMAHRARMGRGGR
jgi:hypothetical protein